MPGTYTFKPVEAKLTQGASGVNATNPYCTFVVGNDKIQSQVCTKGGQHPHWTDSVTIPIPDDPSAKVVVMLKDKGRALNEEDIGSFTLNLKDIQQTGQVSKWYNLSSNGKAAGQILIESSFKPSGQKKLIMDEGAVLIKENLTTLDHALPESIYIEQRQVIEPHTFVKQVETVETRSHTKEIEVMEPIKVIKQVPVTETVHVKKLVEVTKPEVVTKEIEVMEPQLVTKVIQVVEDVPVKRKVEVVEMRTVMEEIDTMEPQTVMKAVEVTEYVPVKKTVQVTEPVTIKKDVEYVEPVITTKTVTKEIPQPVIISEQITCSTGPATLLGLKKGEVVVERKMMKEEVKQQVKAAEVVVKEKKITEKVVEAPTKTGKEVVAEKVEVQETVKPLVKKSLATAVTATTATTAAAIKKTGGVFSEHDFF